MPLLPISLKHKRNHQVASKWQKMGGLDVRAKFMLKFSFSTQSYFDLVNKNDTGFNKTGYRFFLPKNCVLIFYIAKYRTSQLMLQLTDTKPCRSLVPGFPNVKMQGKYLSWFNLQLTDQEYRFAKMNISTIYN